MNTNLPTPANGSNTVENINAKPVNPVWKVSYVHLEDRMMRRPFFKRTAMAQAATRQEAIEKVVNYVGCYYGEFRASKVAGAVADSFFRD